MLAKISLLSSWVKNTAHARGSNALMLVLQWAVPSNSAQQQVTSVPVARNDGGSTMLFIGLHRDPSHAQEKGVVL